jgi:hypothetical protein
MSANNRRVFVVLVLASLCVWLSGGCQDLKYHNIYMAAAGGAAIGAIVGHQSDECGAGAGVGAAVFAVGELLHQVDELNERKLEEAAERTPRDGPQLDPNRVD